MQEPHEKDMAKKQKFESLKKTGVLHVLYRRRNILCTLSDEKGVCQASISCGSQKIPRQERSSSFAPKLLGQLMGQKALKLGIGKVWISLKGSRAKNSELLCVQALKKQRGMKIQGIRRIPGKAHNGCRPRKTPRK